MSRDLWLHFKCAGHISSFFVFIYLVEGQEAASCAPHFNFGK